MGAIGRIFSTPKMPKAPAMPAYTPPPPVPVDNSAEIEAEKAKQRAIAANASGRGSTFLTSGLGLMDQPTTDKKTLLGS